MPTFLERIKARKFASVSSVALDIGVNGETFAQYTIDAGGVMRWGTGSNATLDTNLYRGAIDTLKTDDMFQAVSGIITLVTSGAPVSTPPNGAIAVDTTNHKFYFRSNSAWNIIESSSVNLTGPITSVGAVTAIASQTGTGTTFAMSASPTFTGTVSGITKSMVGLGNADNTSDANKPISSAQQTALDLKLDDSQATAFGLSLLDDADAAAGRTTLTLGNVDNTSDASKPVSTAQQTALNLKANLASPTFTGTVTVPTPSNPTDAATKAYADAITQSLDIKDSVRVASTADIAVATALVNGSTIDGVVVATGDRVLLKNQTAGAENGIYVVVASGVAPRSTDANTSAKVTTGMYVFVSEGTVSADMGYVISTNDAITLDTTALVFTQFSGAGQITAGTGLSKSGNTLSINTAVTADLTTVQTFTNKTLTSPAITTPTGIVKGDVGLGSVDNTTDANKPVSTATQTALDLKANLASPTFTGTVGGITKTMVGLGNADNTSDANKPVSTATQTALDLKANLASPTFTGTVTVPAASFALAKLADIATARILGRNTAGTGVIEELTAANAKTVLALVKGDVGLGNVDNTSDAGKPVSTAQQTALDLKANLAGPTFTGTVILPSTTSIGNVTNTELGYIDGVTSAIQTQLDGKLDDAQFSGLAKISVSTGTPGSPSTGDLWVDTN